MRPNTSSGASSISCHRVGQSFWDKRKSCDLARRDGTRCSSHFMISAESFAVSLPIGVDDLSTGPVAVENIHIIAGCEAQQTALFYLHNLCLETDQSILFTGRGEPQHWLLTLPDLESRLRGTTLIQLHPPDDALLRAVLIKLFSDRQLSPSPELITYVVRRIDRSFDAAQKLVVALDALSLGEQRPLSRRLAARLLEPPQENLL